MTNRLQFDPMTRIRLEVERDPTAGEYLNRVANPTGALGAWGWVSPTDGSYMDTPLYSGTPALRYVTVGGSINFFWTVPFKVLAGEQVRGHWDLVTAPVSGYRMSFLWFDVTGAPLSGNPSSAGDNVLTSATNAWTTARTVPTGAAFAALMFEVTKADFSHPYPTSGASFAVRNVRVFSSASGSLSDSAMIANAAAPNVYWLNVLGPTHEIRIHREEFDLGTLTATVLDSSLDPATAPTLRRGRKVRVTALDGGMANTLLLDDPTAGKLDSEYVLDGSGGWEPLFTGSILNADVSYELPRRRATDPKHARISLNAVDPMSALNALKRRKGVDTVAALPWVLEGGSTWTDGLSVPWDCDGYTGHVGPTPLVGSTNDNATVADQVALTRDSVLGYAWIDRTGVLRVRTNLFPIGPPIRLDETQYATINLSFDPTRLINSLDVRILQYDSGSDTTSEGVSALKTDAGSVFTWGRQHRQFTMSLTALATWNPTGPFLDDFAAKVFAANANPAIMPETVRLPINTDAHRASRAFVDLYDLRQVVNSAKGVDQALRVTSVDHQMTTESWLVDVGFAREATVAIPQRQP